MTAPHATSLMSILEPLTLSSSSSSMALAIWRIISIGASRAFTVASSSTWSRVGSSFGMPYALDSGSNASASANTRSMSLARMTSPSARMRWMSSSYSAYFFLPVVKLAVMLPSATPRAPTYAAAPPPPGTLTLAASASANSMQLFSISFSAMWSPYKKGQAIQLALSIARLI